MATYTYPSSLIENAPRTNVGIVNIGDNQFVAPRDPRAKDLLNYAAPSEPVFYDRPEELEFAPDPNEPGIYNTELNPFNPSSKFFPYEPDYAGIMSTRAYEDVGAPMGTDATMQKRYWDKNEDFYGKIPEVYGKDGELILDPVQGQLIYDAKGEPVMEDNYGKYKNNQINVSPSMHAIGPPQLGYQDPEEQRDTVFHEGKHFFIDQYGQLVPKTSALLNEHNPIYFADMWRKNPYYNAMTLGKEDALAFMEMQNLGKKVTQGKYELPESRNQTWNRRWEELVNDPIPSRFDYGNATQEQRFNQFDAMYAPGRGDYTRPTMSQGEMAHDARMTGGGVNPHEATRAQYQKPGPVGAPPRKPSFGAPMAKGAIEPPQRHHFNEGGIAGLPGEWSPATIEGGEETFDLRSLGLDPGILSIEDLEDLFEQVGLDKSIIHKLINTGGLSQLVS